MHVALIQVQPTPLEPSAFAQSQAFRGVEPELLLQNLSVKRRRIAAGQPIFSAGDAYAGPHFLHCGVAKSSIASADGRQRVTGFHLRGELLGLESLGTATHACDAIALDDVEVWQLPGGELLAACARNPLLQRALTEQLTRSILSERRWMLSVGTLNAEQRVALLLLDFGDRLCELGFSASHFILRMTRAEIGSFLGLQLETVTRAMSLLAERGLIAVERRDVRILDTDRLRAVTATPARTH